MEIKKNFSLIICFFLILASGLTFRFVGLTNRVHFDEGDEAHYRGDMSRMGEWFKYGTFRDHSVRHPGFQAPHGLVGPFFSYVCGMTIRELFGPWLPENEFIRDNLLSRFSNALMSTVLVAVIFFFAKRFYSIPVALALMFITALSPVLILWGRTEYLDASCAFFGILVFFYLWDCCRETAAREIFWKSVIAGMMNGLAIGTKWSAVFITPFVPLTFFLVRRFGRSQEPVSADRWFYLGFFCSLIIVTLSVVSIESFQWVIFPDIKDGYGDPDFEKGVFDLIKNGLMEFVQWPHWSSILLWGGVLFPALAVIAYGRLIFQFFQRRSRQEVFLMMLNIVALVYFVVNNAGFGSRRAYFTVHVAILSLGYFLVKFSAKKLSYCLVFILLTTLPLSLYYGLRFGLKPILFNIYGSENGYFDYLPVKPKYHIFKLKERHRKLRDAFGN